MATFDTESGRVTIEIVYYGPAGAGKTTNLESLSPIVQLSAPRRITPRRVGANRVFAISVPAGSLGSMLGAEIAVNAVTIQGPVTGEDAWTRLIYDADGIVFVADSFPGARSDNARALKTLRNELKLRESARANPPVVLQWNKRDLADARPIVQLDYEFNHEGYPSLPATAIRGTGVVETFTSILTRAVTATYRARGGNAAGESALEQSLSRAFVKTIDDRRQTSIEQFGSTIPLQSVAEPSPRSAFDSPPNHRPTSEGTHVRRVPKSDVTDPVV